VSNRERVLALPRLMQAPIGPAATSNLVAAVSAAGGLGCLAASWTPVDVLREQIQTIQRLVDRPYAVNLVMAFEQAERIEIVLDERVPVLTMSWGIDPVAIGRAHAAGTLVMVQVGDVAAADEASAAGADALIVQGVEAGGHVQSTRPLEALFPEIRARAAIPMYVTGGISSARAVTVARHLGAFGVAAGTAFLVADEADVHPAYRDRLLAAASTDTLLTTLFDIGWRDAPHRVLRNVTVDAWQSGGSPPTGSRPGEREILAHRAGRRIVRYSDAQPTRDTTGDVAAMALYAGLGVDSLLRVEAAAEIAARLLTATEALA
jgi:nitronate monooxygenase